MKKSKTGIISPLKGVPIAIAAMWGLGSLGVLILLRVHNWWFLIDETVPRGLSLQILSFYIALFGAKLPSVVIAGYIIGKTDLRRPYLATIVTVLIFQVVTLGITLLRWPWTAMPTLPSSVPMLGEVASIFLLTASSAFGVWLPALWNRLYKKRNGDNNELESISK